jgi:two-component system chemotaxis response regulator CheY
MLGADGHEAFEAVNGEETLTRYAEVQPDVVLVDILMSLLDGVSATRKILERDPGAKIVVITASGKAGLEKECLDAGAKKFLRKPFKVNDLLDAINSQKP